LYEVVHLLSQTTTGLNGFQVTEGFGNMYVMVQNVKRIHVQAKFEDGLFRLMGRNWGKGSTDKFDVCRMNDGSFSRKAATEQIHYDKENKLKLYRYYTSIECNHRCKIIKRCVTTIFKPKISLVALYEYLVKPVMPTVSNQVSQSPSVSVSQPQPVSHTVAHTPLPTYSSKWASPAGKEFSNSQDSTLLSNTKHISNAGLAPSPLPTYSVNWASPAALAPLATQVTTSSPSQRLPPTVHRKSRTELFKATFEPLDIENIPDIHLAFYERTGVKMLQRPLPDSPHYTTFTTDLFSDSPDFVPFDTPDNSAPAGGICSDKSLHDSDA
jgi:hypothetical protein